MSQTNANGALGRKTNQAKSASSTNAGQGSRIRGDGPATRTRRGATKHEDQSDNES
jgi:tubulin polyglutamylase TTLL6/13